MTNSFKLFVENFFNTESHTEVVSSHVKQNKARHNSEIFKSFIENLPVMFYVITPSPNYQPVYLSPTFERLGFSSEEWKNNPDLWKDLIHTDDRERVLSQIFKAIESGEVSDCEYRVRDKNGNYFWIRDRGALIYDAYTGINFWQGVILDINNEKIKEIELSRKESLYRAIAQNIPLTGILIFDRDLRFTLADGEMLKKLELSSEEVEGKTLFEVFPPAISAEFEKYYRKALSGKTVTLEKEIEPDFIIGSHILPLKDDEGNIYGGMSIWQDITEDRQKTKRLEESEEKYRELFDRANDIICVHDLEGNYISLNKTGERIFGYSQEEIAKLNFRDVVAPEYLPLTSRMMEEKLKDRTKYTIYEIECINKEGKRVALEVSTNLILKDNEPVAIHGIARDITERKQIQEALFKKDEMIRNFLENARDMIYLLDVEGRFVYVNQAMTDVYGYSQEELIGMHYSKLIAPEKLEISKQKIEDKLFKLERTVYESIGITKDGRRIIIELSSNAVVKDGKAIGIQGIARDITERKLMEEALSEREDELRTFFENSTDLIYMVDPLGKFSYVNKAMQETFGYSAAEFKAIHYSQLVEPENQEAVIERAEEKLRGEGERKIFELSCITKDGRKIFLEVNSGYITKNGEVIGIQGIARDITERRLMQEALTERENQLSEFFENSSDFIYMVNAEGKYIYTNKATQKAF